MKQVKKKAVKWRKAVDEMCRSCNYDEFDDGTWRAQVESCSMTDCALYAIRPVTGETRRNRAAAYQNEHRIDNGDEK